VRLRTRRVVLAAAMLAGGCDAEDDSTALDTTSLPKLADVAEKEAPEEEAPVDETIRLDNGFIPDPHVAEGSMIGSVEASTLADGCSGWLSTEPDHVLETLGTFAELRLLAHAEQDATLVVETPAGERLCADDDEGTDPILVAPFTPGTYRIWVGAPEADVEMAYVLGISELSDVSAASLAN